MPDLKENLIQSAKQVISKMGFGCDVEVADNEQPIKLVAISVSSEDSGFLIGKNGCNLESLEHVMKILVNKNSDAPRANFIVDINNYRKTKTSQLIAQAKIIAERVIQTMKSEALEPMSSYERKLIHLELASYNNISTESIGDEPRRRVVVKPLIIS